MTDQTDVPWWEIRNATGEDEPTELLIYGYIGEWDDVNSRDVATQLQAVTSKAIHVKINSYGGSVFTAQAILSTLKRHAANVTVFIDGIAASAATIIAMAGERVVIPSNAMMMIHNPLTWAGGNATDFREYADMLDKIRDSIIAAYQGKTSLSREKLVELMDAETWLSADEAVEFGFADEVEVALRVAASIDNGILTVNGMSFDSSRFANIPAGFAVSNTAQTQKPTPKNTQAPATPEKEEIVDLETLKNKYPELYNQIKAEGVSAGQTAERARIKAIEDLAGSDHKDLVNKAKFDTGASAPELAVEIMNAEKARKKAFLENRLEDADELENAADPSDPKNSKGQKEKEKETVTNAMSAGFNKNRK